MMTLTRRGFGRTALGAALASQAAIPSARATTTMARTDRLQGAGFYRFPLGDKTLTVLADGMSEFPGADLFAVNVPADEFVATQSHLFEPTGHVDFHMNQLLVEAGDRRILIDGGPGGVMGADFGRQGLAREDAGVDPATVARMKADGANVLITSTLRRDLETYVLRVALLDLETARTTSESLAFEPQFGAQLDAALDR